MPTADPCGLCPLIVPSGRLVAAWPKDAERYPGGERSRAQNELAAARMNPLFLQKVAPRLLQGQEHRLRIWREHRGLTQTELGAISGVQQGYIAQIESGRKTGSIETLKKLSAALRIDIDDLVAAE